MTSDIVIAGPIFSGVSRRGMTLVEILAVVVILGLLAVTLTMGITAKMGKAKQEICKTQIAQTVGQLQVWQMEKRGLPPASAGLRTAMLAELWDAKEKTMGAGLFELADLAKEKRLGTYGGPSTKVGLCQATRRSAIYALCWNVIDETRREQLYPWIWNGRNETMKTEEAAMLFYHLFEVLYAHDDPAADTWVLEAMRTK